MKFNDGLLKFCHNALIKKHILNCITCKFTFIAGIIFLYSFTSSVSKQNQENKIIKAEYSNIPVSIKYARC